MEQEITAEVLEEEEIIIKVETTEQKVEVHGIAEQGPKGDGPGVWGQIIGTLLNQTDIINFINSSIATNTANYINNNGQPFTSLAQLQAYAGIVTNNDYAFITGTDEYGNTYYDRYKATVNGSTVTWAKEYRLNNSSFTAAQWAAISSGITSALVNKLNGLENTTVEDNLTSTSATNALSAKQGKILNESKMNINEISKSLTTAGWYRVACLSTLTSNPGATGGNYIVMINTDYQRISNQASILAINIAHQNVKITNLSSQLNSDVVTQVRVVAGSDGKWYLEIYYNKSLYNIVRVKIIEQCVKFGGMIDFTTGDTVTVIENKILNNDNIDYTKIPANADLNNYRNAGFYYCNSNSDAATMSNVPVAAAFSLLVQRNAGINQIFIRYETQQLEIYVRNFYNNNWGEWKKVFLGNPYVMKSSLSTLGITDLNNATTPGIYNGYGSYTNCPVGSSTPFKLKVTSTKEVADNSTWIFQEITTLKGDIIYQRGKLNTNEWYSWKSITLS